MAHVLGQARGVDRIVRGLVGAAPERATRGQGLDVDETGQGSHGLGDVQLVQGLDLGGGDQLDVHAIGDGRRVHRLHGGVGQIGEVVGRLEQLAAKGVAGVAYRLEHLRLDGGVALALGDGFVVGQDLVG